MATTVAVIDIVSDAALQLHRHLDSLPDPDGATLISPIHNRMPVILLSFAREQWLDSTTDMAGLGRSWYRLPQTKWQPTR